MDTAGPAVTLGTLLARCHPPSWTGTKHGDRSVGRLQSFIDFASSGMVAPDFLGLQRPAAAVFTAPKLVAWLDSMPKSLGVASRNRALSAVLAVWKRAHQRGMLGPPPGGLYEREGKGRKRVLSPEEEPRLMAALAEPYRSLAAFLLASGLRVSEALALAWMDVEVFRLPRPITDRFELVVRVADSKNGDARVVPGVRWRVGLPEPVPGGLMMFPGLSQSAFNHAWAAARASMGLQKDPEFVPHMLRHTYATRLVVAGVPLSVVARLMGHRSVRSTLRYSHVSDADAERWVRQVSGIH